ncbi:unnamed protein product [Pleuronectes platessa]|uniref:Uncharacterized protein n=1 Tax=Pleuronectes platessa TaxID=8262 RepID=A0A9N7TZ42_PLEPL|nr:unnamed protein product [Pleuronectes platessa]
MGEGRLQLPPLKESKKGKEATNEKKHIDDLSSLPFSPTVEPLSLCAPARFEVVSSFISVSIHPIHPSIHPSSPSIQPSSISIHPSSHSPPHVLEQESASIASALFPTPSSEGLTEQRRSSFDPSGRIQFPPMVFIHRGHVQLKALEQQVDLESRSSAGTQPVNLQVEQRRRLFTQKQTCTNLEQVISSGPKNEMLPNDFTEPISTKQTQSRDLAVSEDDILLPLKNNSTQDEGFSSRSGSREVLLLLLGQTRSRTHSWTSSAL